MNIGDYVVRLSYNKDIIFRIIDIDNGIAHLKGISYRIIADAPLHDIQLATLMRSAENAIMELVQKNIASILEEHQHEKYNGLQKVVKVLHIDGDAFYMNICLHYYKLLGVSAIGENVKEVEQPQKVKELILKHNPDILVLTGHDAIFKKYPNRTHLDGYRNSKYYVEAVKEARKLRPTSQQLVIYAGACQSHFEELLQAGADYASSPSRVLIHALDPPFIVERIAHCPFNEVLTIENALKYTITRFEGLGGYETYGKLRKGGPDTKLGEEQMIYNPHPPLVNSMEKSIMGDNTKPSAKGKNIDTENNLETGILLTANNNEDLQQNLEERLVRTHSDYERNFLGNSCPSRTSLK
ncbi:MAG: sporulation peptidase YabG [Epulopiscium sp. Nele67-Bin005]|nr:MAG: sporulation peptidase YabG [Epulopiscium sp. Nele67-Bin005]